VQLGRTFPYHLLAGVAATVVLAVATSTPGYAASDLATVIDGVRNWAAGLLAGLATLFLLVGSVRYMAAAGNRREMERGKEAMKSAVVGYVLALMAPLLIQLLRQIVGI
jgi:chromate transport protein ChrA